MKKLFFAFAILVLANVLPAQTIKKISINQLDSVVAHSNVPLVINFWATFCKPCVQEIPYFETSVQQYQQQGLQLILVSLDLPDYYPSKIKTFVQSQKIVSTVYWLNESNADIFCPVVDKKWSGAIPATLLVNNKKNYRLFYDRQLTPLQVQKALIELMK